MLKSDRHCRQRRSHGEFQKLCTRSRVSDTACRFATADPCRIPLQRNRGTSRHPKRRTRCGRGPRIPAHPAAEQRATARAPSGAVRAWSIFENNPSWYSKVTLLYTDATILQRRLQVSKRMVLQLAVIAITAILMASMAGIQGQVAPQTVAIDPDDIGGVV